MKEITGNAVKENTKIVVIASRFNSFIVDKLLTACLKTLIDKNIAEENITLIRVPGAYEIPVMAKNAIHDLRPQAVITLGAVIRGETAHFEYISGECARGLSQVSIETNIPVIFGVLTTENTEQALDRSGDDESNKGVEAAEAALEMVSVIAQTQALS